MSVSDPWVAVLRTVEGNSVIESVDEAAYHEHPLHFHVVVVRRSAIFGSSVSPSLDALPDSDICAHWYDAGYVANGAALRLRFEQAQAMAVGLNEWEAGR